MSPSPVFHYDYSTQYSPTHFTKPELRLRGGGGQIEDEEHVYSLGEYVNWDQVEPEAGSTTLDQEKGHKEIRELRKMVVRLEEQMKRLSELTNFELELFRSARIREVSRGLKQENRNRDHENQELRDRRESFVDPSLEATSPLNVSASQSQLLAEWGTLKVHANEQTTKFVAIQMPWRFTLPLCDTGSSLSFQDPSTIYHFPTGLQEDTMRRVMLDKGSNHGPGHSLHIIRVTTPDMEAELKASLREFWDDIGLPWDYLTGGDWKTIGEGTTYIATDQNIIHAADGTIASTQPHIRGGYDNRPYPSECESIQRIPSDYRGFGEDFDRIYDRLLQDAAGASCRSSPDEGVDAWIKLATVLQARNRQVERELEEFKEIYHSLEQDVRWLVGTQAELEEQLEAMVEDKAELATELEALKMRWTSLHEILELPDSLMESTVSGESGGDNAELDPSCVALSKVHNSTRDPIDSAHHQDTSPHSSETEPSATHIATTSFEFYPARSTIIFPGTIPQIFQFPSATNLPQIRSILSHRHDHGLEDEPYAVRMREILDIREDMGLELPNSLQDEKVVIGIPDLPASVNQDTVTKKIEAWETFLEKEMDGMVAEFRYLELHADHFDTDAIATRPRGGDVGDDNLSEERYDDLGDLVNELNRMADELSDLASISDCACWVCKDGETEHSDSESLAPCSCIICGSGETGSYVNVQATDLTPSRTSVRGGESEQHRMVSQGETKDKGSDRRVEDKQMNATNDEYQFVIEQPRDSAMHHVQMFDVRNWRDIASSLTPPRCTTVPPNSPKGLTPVSRHDTNSPISLSLDQSEVPSTTSYGNLLHRSGMLTSRTESDISVECHPRGEGCEAWCPFLNPERNMCEFCHMPFDDKRGFVRELLGEEVMHEDDAPVPTCPATIAPLHPPRKEEQAIVEDAVDTEDVHIRGGSTRLRGGAASMYHPHNTEMNDDWQTDWNYVGDHTHFSDGRFHSFRKSSPISIRSMANTPLPENQHSSSQRRRVERREFYSRPNTDFDHGESTACTFIDIGSHPLTNEPISLGEFNHSPHPTVPTKATDLARSKTHPLSRQERRFVDFDHAFCTREQLFPFSRFRKVAVRRAPIMKNETLEDKLERWLENHRPAPLVDTPLMSASMQRKEENKSGRVERSNQSSVDVHAAMDPVRIAGPNVRRQRAFDFSAVKMAFQHSRTPPQAPKSVSFSPPDDGPSITPKSLHKRIAHLLRLIRIYIKKLVSFSSRGARHKSSSQNRPQNPTPTSKPTTSPLSPSSPHNTPQRWNRINPFLPRSVSSSSIYPRSSSSLLPSSPRSRRSPSSPPTPPAKNSPVHCSYAPNLRSTPVRNVAQKCFTYVEEPCVAGPSDPLRMSRLRAAKVERERSREEEEYSGMMWADMMEWTEGEDTQRSGGRGVWLNM